MNPSCEYQQPGNRITLNVCIVTALILQAPITTTAEVGDPTLQTNHPQYAGEGAFQEIEDCVRFATAGKTAPQDKAIAMYLWLLTHQWHLMSPQEWCVPGRTPDTAKAGDYEMVVFDANRARFSYGYGLCGTVHSWNEPYWRALGMPARRRAFPGHVNSEIFYGQAWHAFDTDMAGLLFRKDGVVAGYADIIADPTLVDSVKSPLPHYPFAWPSDFNVMRQGWLKVAADKKKWYSLYNSGYAAHPAIVQLRAGESFTRWYDRDHFGGPDKRRFWHHQPGGPSRNWAFLDNGQPFHAGEKSNSRGNVSYSNGEFVYTPSLTDGRFHEGVLTQTGQPASRSTSPRLFSQDEQAAAVTFRHFSPYVICGDPLDDANPMSAKAEGGLVLHTKFVGDVQIEVSADEGQTWHGIGAEQQADSSNAAGANTAGANTADVPAGTRRFDLTEFVKGRYGWQVRFTWRGNAGIDFLRFNTVTQVCQAIYPRLKTDGTEVTYRSASRGVVAVLPNFALPESAVSVFERVALRSGNVQYHNRLSGARRAYETTDNKAGTVVFAVNAPAPLTEVRAAVRYQLRVPPPAVSDYHLDISTDNGQTWTTFANSEIPADNEFSSGWLAGRAPVTADAKTALIRVHMYANGHRTGLIDAQFYGVYKTAPAQALTVDYGWHDGKQLQTHSEHIAAGTKQHTFTVPTKSKITDKFVRLTAQ